jgi:hypothetical protein
MRRMGGSARRDVVCSMNMIALNFCKKYNQKFPGPLPKKGWVEKLSGSPTK